VDEHVREPALGREGRCRATFDGRLAVCKRTFASAEYVLFSQLIARRVLSVGHLFDTVLGDDVFTVMIGLLLPVFTNA